jgi:hypothetical protein
MNTAAQQPKEPEPVDPGREPGEPKPDQSPDPDVERDPGPEPREASPPTSGGQEADSP